jgi:hypothetical protein
MDIRDVAIAIGPSRVKLELLTYLACNNLIYFRVRRRLIKHCIITFKSIIKFWSDVRWSLALKIFTRITICFLQN